MDVWNEILRKGIHLGMLIIPVGYYFFPKITMLVILGVMILLALGVEIVRFRWPLFSKHFNKLIGRLLRPSEKSGLTGATYLFIGSFFTIFLFEKTIALIALLFLIISDALAALVGKLLGKRLLYKDKTIEGSIMFLSTALCIVFFLPTHPLVIGLIGVCAAFVIDVFVVKMNDNFFIPVGSGLVMQILATVLN
ncbi:hypothetical protein JW824_02040 [bacterium]|nr:hypothetical protein [bacterium]